MRPFIHNDGRGAQLNFDDRLGIAALYTPAGASPAASFFTLAPCRLLDTRDEGGPLFGAQRRTFSVLGLCGIPDAATSLAANVTAVTPSYIGSLTLVPAHVTGPLTTSNVSFTVGNTRASQTMIGLSGQGTRAFTLFTGGVSGSGSVDVIIDVTGYFQ